MSERTRKRNIINRAPKVAYGLVGGFIAVAIFALGVGVGSGRVGFGQNPLLSSNSASNNLPADLDYSSVEQVYDSLRVNYDGDLSAEEILDSLKQGIARSTGDPYTEYLNPEAAQSFDDELNGTFSGIGAELSMNQDLVTVVSPLSGFPAEKAGLRPQDIIVEVDGESVYGLSLTEVVNKIRGPEGSTVKLKIARDGAEQKELEITRQQITVPSAEHEITDDNIGILTVSRFSDDTAHLSRQAANEFKQAGVKGVVLDLRSNPGGLLDSAVDLSSLWLDRGAVVLEERRDGVTKKTYTASGNPVLKGIPAVVLLNEGSASASEITAGALRDHGVATLVGAKTFGKGSVQSLVKLGDRSILKVTIARWYTPNGSSIDKEGIEPDETVERTEEDYVENRDPQKDRAVEILR